MAIRDLKTLLRSLEPVLHPGTVVFVCVADDFETGHPGVLGYFREAEGLSLILPEAEARAAGLEPAFRAAWISLRVPSDLEAVGLTAAVSSVLAEAGIACNVVAAVHHDHLFVPVEQGEAALALLRGIQRDAD